MLHPRSPRDSTSAVPPPARPRPDPRHRGAEHSADAVVRLAPESHGVDPPPPDAGPSGVLVISRPLLQHRLEPRETALTPPDPRIPAPQRADEIRKTTCYMCACRCGIDVHLADGRVQHIEGNRDHPVNHGVLCAKGAAGIMQHLSPARLRAPLRRTGPRGSGEFREIGWNEALGLATNWLAPLRDRHPEKLAFFTGRDQSQSFTGWWAQQFGTPNYAAHGGFCSVNMAAAGIYTLGGSFWEFGAPDWERTRLLLLFGVAEDHDSNPIKIGLGKLKARGARVISINPIRTGYSAIADQWIGIIPGTDGLLILSLIHLLMAAGKVDLDYLLRWTNAAHLVDQDPHSPGFGSILRDGAGRELVWDRERHKAVPARDPRRQTRAVGHLQRRPHPRPAGVPADGRHLPRPRTGARSRRAGLRPRSRHHPPPRRRARRHRLRPPDHARPPLDRLPRHPPRHDDRPPGQRPRHARHLRPCQRLPDLPRPAPAAAAARLGRDPRRHALQAALPPARRRPSAAAPQGHPGQAPRRPAPRLPPRPRGSRRSTPRAARSASTRPSPGRRRWPPTA